VYPPGVETSTMESSIVTKEYEQEYDNHQKGKNGIERSLPNGPLGHDHLHANAILSLVT